MASIGSHTVASPVEPGNFTANSTRSLLSGTVATLAAWHGPGTSNTVPRTTFNDNGSSKKSSIFVEDASYLRLKNLEVGYSLGDARRIYVSGQTLWTKTNYTGLDPESTDLLDRGTYPQMKSFLFGINAKF